MVNTGKPRRGCSICAKRKIKCDETKPACQKCIKAGWKCPGYPVNVDLIFRSHQRPLQRGPSAVTNREATANINLRRSHYKKINISPIVPPVDERAISFFVHHYVLDRNKIATGEIHGYIPILLRTDDVGLLRAVMVACGLAALANAGNSRQWRIEAYRMYGQVLKTLRNSLHDPHFAVADHTLAAILCLGTFAAITGADAKGLKPFTTHIFAAARCVEMRGPAQFRNTVSIELFLELRRLIVMTVHQLQAPMPFQLGKWSSWILPNQSMETSPANRFAEINGRLASVRFRIKNEKISICSEVVALLLPIDRELEQWCRSLPVSWSYHSRLPPVGAALPQGHDVYPNFWVASMWNNYRLVRIMISEQILSITTRPANSEESARTHAIAVLRDMAAGIHRSVQYHQELLDDRQKIESRSGGMPACYQLAWPLFMSGMLRTTSTSTKRWVSAKLREIGIAMGLQLAITMSERVSVSNASFSDHENWIIGEWYP